MDVIRVRELLRYLEYGKLKKDDIIPESAFFTNVKKDTEFPKLPEAIGYSEFGLIMEKIVEIVIRQTPSDSELFSIVNKIIPESLKKYYKEDTFSKLNIMLTNHFLNYKDIRFQQEWTTKDGIQGHPDIIADDTIYEIKTTNNFIGMRVETILQLFSYYTLSYFLYPKRYKKIGLILPSQLQIITINIEKWVPEEFMNILLSASLTEKERRKLYSFGAEKYLNFMQDYNRYIGCHIRKENLIEAVEGGYLNPLQFFANGNMTGKVDMDKQFQEKLKVISAINPNLFIHSPYCLNLSNPWGNYVKEKDAKSIPWTCEKLIYLLKTGKECGLKGIVVHCGQFRKANKAKNLPEITEDEAVVNMFKSLLIIAEHASEECPLLLETPAGETGETFSKKEHFINFFKNLEYIGYKNKIKMCIDTCHVFAASYNPCDYIRDVIKNEIPIGLIHYNDSKKDCGCRKDLHASPERCDGFIGIEILHQIILLATTHNIPCVRE